MIPNAIGSLVALFPRLEPGYRSRRGRRDPRHPSDDARLILVAILMVWAWQRARHRCGRGSRHGPGRILAASATLAFLWLGFRTSVPRHFDPMFRFYPPFRDF